MNWQQISGNPFFTVALPIVGTLIWAVISQNRGFDLLGKRIDDVSKRIDDIIKRLERIEVKLDNHGERIAKLEGPPLVRHSG